MDALTMNTATVDPKDKVMTALKAYHDGTLTYDQVAELFADFDWPPQDDPDLTQADLLGDWNWKPVNHVDEIYTAVYLGYVTYEQYQDLTAIAKARMKLMATNATEAK